jgi:intein-encoded DNA endonuclease-like protein
MKTIDLVIFPTDRYYSYLKEYICKENFDNPIFIGYDFSNAQVCNLNYETIETELSLKVALEFIQKWCRNNSDKKVKVFFYTPDVSYYYHSLNLDDYLEENIIEFNYLVKECERSWTKDFKNVWLNNKIVTRSDLDASI